MSVYKEGYYIIAEIQNKSKQIWADACDVGVLVKKNDAMWNNVKQLVAWYGVEGTRKEHYKGHVEQKVQLMDEWGWGKKGTETFTVTFCEFKFNGDKKKFGADGFVSIEGGQKSEALKSFKKKVGALK